MSDQQLERWAQEVANWGGRYGEPAGKSLIEELSRSQLGQQETLPTGEAVPSFPASVVLAQMDLSISIQVDVTFTNFLTQGVGGSSLDPGDGFVRVTWGTPGTFKNTADIDAGQGWTHPFTASFLRVEYIPRTQGGARPLQGGQARDMDIAAMITPASDGPQTTITKSVLLPDVASGGLAFATIPRWARNARVMFASFTTDPEWAVLFQDASGTVIASFGSEGASVSRPSWAGQIVSYLVPQRAVNFFFASVPPGAYNTPAVIFELDL